MLGDGGQEPAESSTRTNTGRDWAIHAMMRATDVFPLPDGPQSTVMPSLDL